MNGNNQTVHRESDSSLAGTSYSQEILNAIAHPIVVLNRDGTIAAINRAWAEFAKSLAQPGIAVPGVGSSYLDLANRTPGFFGQEAVKAHEGIGMVLAGAMPCFSLEFACHEASEKRWFAFRVASIESGGAVATHEDISKRKRLESESKWAENHVQASEIRYRRLFECSKDGILILDGNTGRIIDANPSVLDLLERGHNEVRGKELHEIGLIADQESGAWLLAQMKGSCGLRHDFLLLPTPSGAVREIELTCSAYSVASESVIQCNVRDITDRKRAERLLFMERGLLRTLIDNLPSCIFVKDVEGRYLVTNVAYTRRLGAASEQDVLGKTVRDFFPRNVADWFEADDNMVLRGGGPILNREEPFEIDGERGWFSTSKLPLRDFDGMIIGLIGISHDITAERLETERLKQSEANLATAQHLARLGSWELHRDRADNADRSHLAWSEEVYRIFGREPAEYSPSRDGFLNAVHPEDRMRVDEAMARSFRDGTPFDLVHRIVLPDGAERIIHNRSEAVRDAQTGDVRKMVGTVQDVTERERAVQAANQYRQQLESIINSVDGIVWEADVATLRFTFVSLQAEQILGYAVQQWLDEPSFWTDHMHSEDRDWAPTFCLQATKEGRSHEFEYRMIAADGREIWFRDIVSVFCEDGKPAKLRGILVDITERKCSEEQTRVYAQRLTLATETARMGVWERDVVSGHITWDPRMYAMYGVPVAEPMTYAKWAGLVHPSDLAEAERQAQVAIEMSEQEAFSFRIIRPRDGQVRHIQAAVSANRNDKGQVTSVIGVNFDITEAKRAEATLRESESRLKMATQVANVGLWDWDFNSNRVHFSTEWKSQLGYAPNEISDQVYEWSSRLHPDDYGRMVARVEAYRSNARLGYDVEFRMRHKDGSYRWIHARAQIFRDAASRPVRMLGCHLDITEQKQAQQELYESNQKLRMLIQVSPLAIVALDVDGKVLMWNPAAEQIFGWSSAEVLGRAAPFVPIEQSAAFRAFLDTGLAGESQSVLEVKCLRRNLTHVEVSFWTVPLRDSHGNISSLLGFVADNTERKSLEEQFRQSQKMEAVGRLAGGVAHDFNNMLTIISGYCELLLASSSPDDPNVDLLVEIRKAGERSAALTRQLLAFSRKQVLEPRVIDLNAIVADCESMLRRLVGEDIVLNASLRPGLARLNADPGQIEHVLMNLVVNARDAMPLGGKISIETADVVFDEDSCHAHSEAVPGPYVLLSVSDTGCGMDETTRARIFEPFFSTKEKGKGTGLGLAIVYGVVKQSGGFLSVASEVGIGSTFKIYLPAITSEPDAEPSQPVSNQMPVGDETILLVEDEDGVRALSRHILQSCGYTVLEAASGVEAIHIAETHPAAIDLLLTDVVMPEMGGRQAAERISTLIHGIKVLYLSGYTDDAIVRHGVLVSETEFLQKPFTPSSLAVKVRKVLDK